MNNDKQKEIEEEKIINQRFQELISDYLNTKHRKRTDIITKAFNFANQAHKGVRRRSGEPYILHPISVAKIVCNEIGLGSTSICAALLHDVVEDTDYTVEDIENLFGSKIANIVDGLTKLSSGIIGDKVSEQAENFKKLLLTMSTDIRVILIKIADRLHNMRTLGSMIPSKQYKIAGETIYIYAPLANRLGLYKIKTELEDLSFKYEHPNEYFEIERKLGETASEREEIFRDFTAPIREKLDKMGLKYTILARIKSVYSIWNKMQAKNISFEEVYDLLAVRIVFQPTSLDEEIDNCFSIYANISKIYKPHPERFRNWVSHPKANGYQALHVTLMSNRGQWIEVQIRSERMDDIAEQGFAAHWKYKEGGGSEDEGELSKWLNTVKEILEDPQPDAMDFLDTIKLNLFASEIFIFTPKGDIKTLPKGATVLDFAFSLHTKIGQECIGAKVNHKLVPMNHVLNSGDQVEILTSRSQKVQPQWELYVTTAKAKAKIASILKKDKKEKLKEGEETIMQFLKRENIKNIGNAIYKIRKQHNYKTDEELFIAIGRNKVLLTDNERNLIKEKQGTNWLKYINFGFNSKSKNDNNEEIGNEKINTKNVFKLTGENLQKRYTIAECCNPIAGDDVLGYIDEKDRIIIHKRKCPNAIKLKSSYGNRILATEWDTNKEISFLVYIYIKGIDSVGLLNEVTQVISTQLNVNMRKLNIETNDGIFEGKIQLWVHDVEDVKELCMNLKKIENIKQANRVEE